MTCNKCGKELDENVKVCDACGESVVETAKPKKKNKKLIGIIAAVVAVLVLVIALGSGGEDSEALAVPFENDTGAVLNMTFDEYSQKFGETLDELFVLAGGNPTNFDLSQFWNNKVEPMTGIEENSGAEYTLYTAFLNGTHIAATIQDDKVKSIDICFNYDNNDLAVSSAVATFMLCSGLEFEEANKIFETVRGGIADNTMIYKDGVLYCVTTSTVCYTVMAASEDFVQSLEDSGKCNILRW